MHVNFVRFRLTHSHNKKNKLWVQKYVKHIVSIIKIGINSNTIFGLGRWKISKHCLVTKSLRVRMCAVFNRNENKWTIVYQANSSAY